MSRGRVLYLGAFRFPDGDAAAARVLGVGKGLRALGYAVEYLGWETHPRTLDLDADGQHRFDGFPYRSMNEFSEGAAVSPVHRTLRFISMGRRTLTWLRRADLHGVKAVIVYHGGAWFLTKLRHFCRDRGIRLLFDCTEWYDPAALPGGALGPAAIDSELRMRWIYPSIGRGVVISRYLEDHFASKGCEVVRIPPTFDLDDAKWTSLRSCPTTEPLRLVYAGSPGKKDLLQGFLLALSRLQDLGVPVIADVIGPSEELLLTVLGPHANVMEKIRPMLRLDGRIPQDQVPARVAEAHFSVLIRPDKRYARAGFSTKLVESLAVGVPVIANPTGDIACYIQHGVNGYLLRDTTPDAFVEAVLAVRGLSASRYRAMRSAAASTARRYFDYRADLSHLTGLQDLIGEGA